MAEKPRPEVERPAPAPRVAIFTVKSAERAACNVLVRMGWHSCGRLDAKVYRVGNDSDCI